MNITKRTCNLNLIKTCNFFLSGVEKLYVAYSKDSQFILQDNIIVDDILDISWYNIAFSNCKINQNIKDNREEVIMELNVPYIDFINKQELIKLAKNYYSFLIVTKNQEVYFLENLLNSQFVETYNPNGFEIKEISTQTKSLFQVNYNYYLSLIGRLPIVPPSEECSLYYNDFALTSIQANALTIQCLVEDYSGWI